MDQGQLESLEARIGELERVIARIKNPGTLSTAEAVSLKDHFDSRLIAIEHATNLAATTMEKRLDSMNEFRDTLRDQAGKFVTRDEANLQVARIHDSLIAKIEAIQGQVDKLQTFKDRLEGKASMTAVVISYLIGGAGLFVSILSLVLR
jgi:hypothetical protein